MTRSPSTRAHSPLPPASPIADPESALVSNPPGRPVKKLTPAHRTCAAGLALSVLLLVLFLALCTTPAHTQGICEYLPGGCYDPGNPPPFSTPGLGFASGQALGDLSSPDVALGDLDGDGDLDAFVANGEQHYGSSGQPNWVYLNQGGAQAGTPGTFGDSGQQLENS